MVDAHSTDSVETLATAMRELASEEQGEEDLDSNPPPPMRRNRLPGVELNVVPLVDVLFLLMVFFVIGGAGGIVEGILASRMARRSGSGSGGEIPVPSSPIVVEVRAVKPQSSVWTVRFGTLHYEADSEAQLAVELKRMIVLPGLGADTPVVITTDDEVLWDDVARTWNAILLAGFRDVAFGRPSGRVTGRVEPGR
jgi:biopolymer transport protein ExbD